MKLRGNNVLLAIIAVLVAAFAYTAPAGAEDARFYSLPNHQSNYLVIRPGERGNSAGTTLRPHVVRSGDARQAQGNQQENPAPGTFYSLKRYQPAKRQAMALAPRNPSFTLPQRSSAAAPKAKELASQAPYNSGFYGTAYAGGTEQSWPVATTASQRVSSGFGWRGHPVTGRQAFHKGVDIAAPTGSPVLASADGIVAETGQDKLIGKFVKLHHIDGSQSLYGHLSSVEVKQGDWLQRQQELGKVGSTGRTTGPHLHYALNVNDQAVNPMEYLTPPNRQVASAH